MGVTVGEKAGVGVSVCVGVFVGVGVSVGVAVAVAVAEALAVGEADAVGVTVGVAVGVGRWDQANPPPKPRAINTIPRGRINQRRMAFILREDRHPHKRDRGTSTPEKKRGRLKR